jgi:hypothetical protein
LFFKRRLMEHAPYWVSTQMVKLWIRKYK